MGAPRAVTKQGALVPTERPVASNLGQCGPWEHGPGVARCSGKPINPDLVKISFDLKILVTNFNCFKHCKTPHGLSLAYGYPCGNLREIKDP